jgi:hypothetical protein
MIPMTPMPYGVQRAAIAPPVARENPRIPLLNGIGHRDHREHRGRKRKGGWPMRCQVESEGTAVSKPNARTGRAVESVVGAIFCLLATDHSGGAAEFNIDEPVALGRYVCSDDVMSSLFGSNISVISKNDDDNKKRLLSTFVFDFAIANEHGELCTPNANWKGYMAWYCSTKYKVSITENEQHYVFWRYNWNAVRIYCI